MTRLPNDLERGGRKRKVQTASAVLCYSRMLFFQCNPTFRRFDCKVFLTDALRYMTGTAARVMIDNPHVVVLRGSERDMVPVPEMAAFGERFGFQFVADAVGNANRSGVRGETFKLAAQLRAPLPPHGEHRRQVAA